MTVNHPGNAPDHLMGPHRRSGAMAASRLRGRDADAGPVA